MAVVPLSLLSGWFAGSLHLIAVASAWSYNLWLKTTVLSVLPYVVSFGLLPAFVTAGLPGHPVYGWLVAAGALLGAGAHFANVLPDIDDDLSTGVRGLPHRLGATGSRVAAGTCSPRHRWCSRSARPARRAPSGWARSRSPSPPPSVPACSGGGRDPARRSSACWWSRRSTWRCCSPRVAACADLRGRP